MKKLALFIGLFLLIVAAAYLYVRAPAENAGPVPELVALAPPTAEWIVFVDLTAWRASPILEHLRRLTPDAREAPEYREFVNATGFDYSRDLDQALVALIPEPEQNNRRGNYQPLAIANGRFSRQRITNHALKNGSREVHAGQEILIIRDAHSPARDRDGEILLAFLAARRLILADAGTGNSKQSVRAREMILAAAQPPSPSPALPPLAERAARVTGAPFFAVGRASALNDLSGKFKGDSPMVAQAAQVLSKVQWLTIAARPEQNLLRISVLGECESAWQATQLGLLLDGLLVLARSAIQDPNSRKHLSAREIEHIEATLASIRVERRSNVVELKLEVSVDALALAAPGIQ